VVGGPLRAAAGPPDRCGPVQPAAGGRRGRAAGAAPPAPAVPRRDQRAFRSLLAASLARPERPATAALDPIFTRRQLARLAADLGIDLELPAADLTAEQWAGINAALVRLVEPARWPRGGWGYDSQPSRCRRSQGRTGRAARA